MQCYKFMSNELTTTIDIAKVLIRSGSNAERIVTTIQQGELAYIYNSNRVVVGDGYTLGGYNVGNILYGIGGNSISLSALPLSSNNSGFTYAGDTYFCNSINSYYTLTGTNVENLDSYKQIVTKTAGDNITTTRSTSGALSLLPLSANSLFSNIGQGGVTIDGDYLTLGPVISTNLITYLLSSLNPFYTEMKVQSSDTNYYRITTQTLKFAPLSYNTLELPKYIKFGNSSVNVNQSNWNNQQNGYLYKNNTNVIELSAAPTIKLKYFKTPINLLKQLPALSTLSNTSIDFTTLSTSNVLGYTLSGFENTYNTILFVGNIDNVSYNNNFLQIGYYNSSQTIVPINLFMPVLSGSGDRRVLTQSFYFFAPLSAATTFKYSIGTLKFYFNTNPPTLSASPTLSATPGAPFTLSAIAAM